MALSPGLRLGVYELRDLIGQGGMGEVYRGHDTKLNRAIALKILPEAFALDPERLSRFKREAQLLASLNHTNIAGIFGFEEADGVHALALELVEGPTLADRINVVTNWQRVASRSTSTAVLTGGSRRWFSTVVLNGSCPYRTIAKNHR
jgi:serine/threonine protein kinase